MTLLKKKKITPANPTFKKGVMEKSLKVKIAMMTF